jgi:hypothetical protein
MILRYFRTFVHAGFVQYLSEACGSRVDANQFRTSYFAYTCAAAQAYTLQALGVEGSTDPFQDCPVCADIPATAGGAGSSMGDAVAGQFKPPRGSLLQHA